ncbi:MAG: DHHA1 domain-containing protein [Nitrososphaerales archaeon]
MEDLEGLLRRAQNFEKKLSIAASNKDNILLAAHHDADGLCSAALLSEFIFKKGGHCLVRTTSEPNPKFLERLGASKYDLVLFVDICAGLSSEIAKKFGDKWLIIDHHEITDEEMEEERILNPWQFGFDGSTQISSSGLAYLICEKHRSGNSSFLAIVGALSDRQDVGPRRALIGLNSKILDEDLESFKSIDSRVDLLFLSKESRPVHESISNSVSSYIPGLTGNKDACLASLRSAGIELKASNRWKTIANFSEEEKQQVLECIVPHLSGTTNTVEDLVGTAYLLRSQDEYSLMRDARDAAAILNACGRMGKPGLGMSVCLSSDAGFGNGIEQVFSDYRAELVRSVQNLMGSEDRIHEKSEYFLVIGDGIVGERMTGSICQLMASYSRVKNKVVLLRTTTMDGDVKVSARLGREAYGYDLGKAMMSVARATKGVGGGHKNSAGARFSIVKQQEFQATVDELFQMRK